MAIETLQDYENVSNKGEDAMNEHRVLSMPVTPGTFFVYNAGRSVCSGLFLSFSLILCSERNVVLDIWQETRCMWSGYVWRDPRDFNATRNRCNLQGVTRSYIHIISWHTPKRQGHQEYVCRFFCLTHKVGVCPAVHPRVMMSRSFDWRGTDPS